MLTPMGRAYGPWVRSDWCATCGEVTEQKSWHEWHGEGSLANGIRTTCTYCGEKVPPSL